MYSYSGFKVPSVFSSGQFGCKVPHNVRTVDDSSKNGLGVPVENTGKPNLPHVNDLKIKVDLKILVMIRTF